jgi:putative tributyrin esterase
MALLNVHVYSNKLYRSVTLNVILPTPVQLSTQTIKKKKFKTLYLLHGLFGHHNDWLMNTRLLTWAEAHQIAVVMPSGENSFYVDSDQTGESYGEFIGEELISLTRHMFPLSHKREDTFIGGLSMGGYGAIRNGLKYHETFGAIVGLSNALILELLLNNKRRKPLANEHLAFGNLKHALLSDKNPKVLVDALVKEQAHFPRIYLSCGQQDPLLAVNQDFVQYLKERKIDHVYIEDEGQHDWAYWDKHIERVLPWLLQTKTK